MTRPFVDEDAVAARRYDAWYEAGRGLRMAEAEHALLAELLARFPDGQSVLEVGCGTGHFSRWFAGQGLRVAGLDPSEGMLAVARERGGGPLYLRGASEALPFAAGAFDLVAMVTSLEFMADQGQALREARRVARQGMVLVVLNLASSLGLRRKLVASFRPSPYTKARFHTTGTLTRLLRRQLGPSARVVALRTAVWPGWASPPIQRLPFGAVIGVAVRWE